MNLIQVVMPKELNDVRQLWEEYTNAIGFHPDYLSNALSDFPNPYIPPTGCLLLARVQGKVAGCIALEKKRENIAEIVRLYVRPAFRRTGIGKALVDRVIKEAKVLDYASLSLDTIPSLMKPAFCLYQNRGFRKTSSYYDHRVPANVVCMELKLS